MNQLEQVREQCAKIVSKFVGTDQIVDEIRNLPLPVDHSCDDTACAGCISGEGACIHDAETLRKENEQLRCLLIEFNKIMTDSCDMPINPNEIIRLNEFVLKVRQIIGAK